VATAGATQEDRQLVADELAAAVGEDGRSAAETCPLLLAAFGREPSNPKFPFSTPLANLRMFIGINIYAGLIAMKMPRRYASSG
jgi:hypothetical protein